MKNTTPAIPLSVLSELTDAGFTSQEIIRYWEAYRSMYRNYVQFDNEYSMQDIHNFAVEQVVKERKDC